MFGLSLSKFIFTVFIVGVVWYGFKWLNRVQSIREEVRRNGRPAAHPAAGRRASGARAADESVEDMVKCPVCESYVAAKGTTSCGRDGCPYVG
ncbi:hypothetical protein [Varunaivibrio sulfuroxidans]|uniref:Uncharacterized protein n=1 Tax=Varunaivibrio sulfuroxidans TaxID=1773489 RepID=A0A4V2UNV5_9PROT|nr:hypothetical protein [Varunaivibrio sulfuroxidans]TCS62621.1 uncharacterized protein EDD55_105168 [Varunaivibrio sulfuroxidans]WES30712.1 hypothetical protein P3M64_13930 [Varunaivibrio sulfuroxidans]